MKTYSQIYHLIVSLSRPLTFEIYFFKNKAEKSFQNITFHFSQ